MNEQEMVDVVDFVKEGLELVAAIIKTLKEVQSGSMPVVDGRAAVKSMMDKVNSDRAAIDKEIEERSKG